ncbi:MAG: rhomboid family intramembrane serine protease [Bacteroidetes bacterium]|nr:MAG: rhomboid family intramembrane serine protease [Bacteroidota bacterium]
MNIVDEIKYSFKKGDSLTRLIYVNLGFFLFIKIVEVFAFLFNSPEISRAVISWLALPADLSQLITRPWTVFTYMFLHEGFMHFLFNMLWLFWLGKIFLEYLDGKKLVGIYLLGGLSGAFLFILFYNVFPAYKLVVNQAILLGASASVLAIVVAIAFYVPNYTINLFLIGRVKLKYIAGATVFLSVLNVASSNSGGNIAHLGGALYGYLFISQYLRGRDIAKSYTDFFESVISIFKPRKKMKVTYKKPKTDMEYNTEKAKKQEEINKILEKISKSGYDSLSKKEKEILFNMSDKK